MAERDGLLSSSQNAYGDGSGPSRARTALRKVTRGVKGVLGLPVEGAQEGRFSSSFGVMLSMLGSVVGTGNIWRFPRIMATHAEEGGALVFLLVWFTFLWLWSIPVILIEYGVGRFTNKAAVESFNTLIGPSYRWMGAFLAAVTLGIGSYYSVLLGYCAYYVVECTFYPLPVTQELAAQSFQDLQNGYWPVFTHFLAIVVVCIVLSRGVSTIEPANRIIVPILLTLLLFTFYWAIFLPSASEGIKHMFSPNWDSFADSEVWRDAITQNAWDTGAGAGTFLAYATYMTQTQGAVRLGTITPIINNLVSILCGMIIFCNVFSRELYKGSSIATIVAVLKTNGPFNTGVTFIQMPLLYSSITGGRVLAIMFFVCITLAGLSSLMAMLEQCVHVLEDYGVRRLPAVVIIGLLSFTIGLGSALDINIFVNQDAVWAHALILSGCFLIFLVARYGALKFRRVIYNEFGIGDWPMPYLWVFVILVICPLEGFAMLLWWIVDEIRLNADPYKENAFWTFTPTSLISILTQWIALICILVGINWWIKPVHMWSSRNYATSDRQNQQGQNPKSCFDKVVYLLCKRHDNEEEKEKSVEVVTASNSVTSSLGKPELLRLSPSHMDNTIKPHAQLVEDAKL